MKLTEITKGEFKGKLQHEWMDELLERMHSFNSDWGGRAQWKAEFYADKEPMIMRLYRFGSGNVTIGTARVMFHQLVLNKVIGDYVGALEIHEYETIPRSQSKYPEMSWTVKPVAA